MADFDSGLPIRSEADGLDERVLVKIQDGEDPSGIDKTVEVSEKLVHTRNHGEDPNGVKKQIKVSEEGHVNSDGDYDASNNTKPSSSGMIAHDRTASPDETHQNKRVTAVAGEDDTVCLDVAIRDESGQRYDSDNPLPVAITENEGLEIQDFDQASAVVKDGSTNHDYVVADGVTVLLYGYRASGSGKMKAELQIGDGALTELFVTKDVTFNSTANPNIEGDLLRIPIKVTGTANGTTIRLVKTNRDNQAQDLYSTLMIIQKAQ
jgi:hypothetical protein